MGKLIAALFGPLMIRIIKELIPDDLPELIVKAVADEVREALPIGELLALPDALLELITDIIPGNLDETILDLFRRNLGGITARVDRQIRDLLPGFLRR